MKSNVVVLIKTLLCGSLIGMRNNYTVMVEHEEGQTYVEAVGSAA